MIRITNNNKNILTPGLRFQYDIMTDGMDKRRCLFYYNPEKATQIKITGNC